jgi:hypothetical protein
MPLNTSPGGVKVNTVRDPKEKTYNVINLQSGSLHHELSENDDTGQRGQKSKKKVTLQKNG